MNIKCSLILFAFAGLISAAFIGMAYQTRAPRGQALYMKECANCHGRNLKGQAGWETVGPDGKVKAPPHDETGHTWMHSDDELFHLIKFGMGDVAAPGYISDMPVFAGRLSDDDIIAILDFIKSRWPPGYQAYQIMQNPHFDPAKLPPGHWSLPKTCDRPDGEGK